MYDEARNLYQQGLSLTEIGKKLKINRKKLSCLLRNDGIDIRQNNQKYQYNETFFDVINTEEKAYWLGFLYADGNVINFGKHELKVALAYKDKNHIVKLNNLLSSSDLIREYDAVLNGEKYKSAKLQIVNKYIVDSLISKGCVPNKSLILKFPSYDIVPQHLMNHFIRGYFDGDGSIYIPNDKRTIQLSFVGTQEFLEGIQEELLKFIFCYNKVSYQNKGNVYSFIKSGRRVVKPVFKYLYKDATIYLERKYERFLKVYEDVLASRVNATEDSGLLEGKNSGRLKS